jgi:hypothetical protein
MPAFVCKKDFPLAGRAVMRPRLAGYAETSGLLMSARVAAPRANLDQRTHVQSVPKQSKKNAGAPFTENALHSRSNSKMSPALSLPHRMRQNISVTIRARSPKEERSNGGIFRRLSGQFRTCAQNRTRAIGRQAHLGCLRNSNWLTARKQASQVPQNVSHTRWCG